MDTDAYLARIGFSGRPRPDRASLDALHLAHATHVPFENLDVQMGRSPALDLEALEDKIVRRRRGGYCFEQNSLFLAVLREVGFEVEPWEARVRQGAASILPRTHMLLHVQVEGEDLLADVGFGRQGLLHPVPLDGTVSKQLGDEFRVAPEGERERVLQLRTPEGWVDMYAFVPEVRPAIDFVMGNHFTATYPQSVFVQTLVVYLNTGEESRALRNLTLTVRRGDGAVVERTIARAELPGLLRDQFGLVIPDDAPLRAVDATS